MLLKAIALVFAVARLGAAQDMTDVDTSPAQDMTDVDSSPEQDMTDVDSSPEQDMTDVDSSPDQTSDLLAYTTITTACQPASLGPGEEPVFSIQTDTNVQSCTYVVNADNTAQVSAEEWCMG
jgi:hypothetical protein